MAAEQNRKLSKEEIQPADSREYVLLRLRICCALCFSKVAKSTLGNETLLPELFAWHPQHCGELITFAIIPLTQKCRNAQVTAFLEQVLATLSGTPNSAELAN